MDLNDILREAIVRSASDVHLKVGLPPTFRIHGILSRSTRRRRSRAKTWPRSSTRCSTTTTASAFAAGCRSTWRIRRPSSTRFRVNVFRQRGEPSAGDPRHPGAHPHRRRAQPAAGRRALALERRGLILVTGTTGSGKSTTLAAMIDHINQNASPHHHDRGSDRVHARRRSAPSSTSARSATTRELRGRRCKAALRQDPDVILVGEMRDLETIETAILAAETGHLVIRAPAHPRRARDDHPRHLGLPRASARSDPAHPRQRHPRHRQPAPHAARRRPRHGAGGRGPGLDGARARVHRGQGEDARAARRHRARPHDLRHADLRPVADGALPPRADHLRRGARAVLEPGRLRAQGARHRLHQRPRWDDFERAPQDEEGEETERLKIDRF